MRRARAIGTITLAALLNVFTCSTIEAEPGKGGVTRSSRSAEHRSERGREKTDAQWSADPERGWVRADERHRQNEPGGAAKKHSDGQQKGKGKSKKL